MATRLSLIAAVALFFTAVPSANAQFTAVTARITETLETISDGKVVKTETRLGNFYRATDGSELTQWLKSDGTLDWGSLLDNRTGRSYKLQYANHIARGSAPPPNVSFSPLPPGYMGGQQKLSRWPQNTIEGIPCAVVPINLHPPGKDRVLVGHACNSAEYDLTLRMEQTTPFGTNQTMHQVRQLTEIRLGVNPETKLFDLQGYTVSMP